MKYQSAAAIALALSIGNLIGNVYRGPITEQRLQALETAIHDKGIADLPESDIRKSFGKRAPLSSAKYLDEERRILKLERDAALRELAETKP